ncbi:hypothetical protein COO60DRAFT_704799 [Scenedesmus sp. NREL 46B-D3]|nr:hypothetical protein COO60DRAFT_704799 [Scenedesmus sp. NREL 46B-D3]
MPAHQQETSSRGTWGSEQLLLWLLGQPARSLGCFKSPHMKATSAHQHVELVLNPLLVVDAWIPDQACSTPFLTVACSCSLHHPAIGAGLPAPNQALDAGQILVTPNAPPDMVADAVEVTQQLQPLMADTQRHLCRVDESGLVPLRLGVTSRYNSRSFSRWHRSAATRSE